MSVPVHRQRFLSIWKFYWWIGICVALLLLLLLLFGGGGVFFWYTSYLGRTVPAPLVERDCPTLLVAKKTMPHFCWRENWPTRLVERKLAYTSHIKPVHTFRRKLATIFMEFSANVTIAVQCTPWMPLNKNFMVSCRRGLLDMLLIPCPPPPKKSGWLAVATSAVLPGHTTVCTGFTFVARSRRVWPTFHPHWKD